MAAIAETAGEFLPKRKPVVQGAIAEMAGEVIGKPVPIKDEKPDSQDSKE